MMPWGRLDDTLYDHPKLDALGKYRLPGVGLNTLAVSWSNRFLTDGFVPAERVLRLGGSHGLAELLVAAGFWEKVNGGYRIHDFLDYNDSREQVERRRESARARMRTVRGSREHPTNGQANFVRSSDPVPLPRPVPSYNPSLSANNAPNRDPEIQRMLDAQERAKQEPAPAEGTFLKKLAKAAGGNLP